MTGSVALDVVIGLGFIFLLYSLLTSLIAEIIATNLGLRARNLHAALCRMLDDERVVALLKNKDASGIVNKLYEHPEIKSLSPNRFFSKPSFIPADTFVRTLIDTLRKGRADENLDDLKEGIKSYHLPKAVEDYLLKLTKESHKDIMAFHSTLEGWFNNTMNSASEWYKRNTQVLLFFIGFLVAWVFNVDTISISRKLAVDQEARSQLVQLASNYMESENYQAKIDSISKATGIAYNQRMDSLASISEDLLKDISEAQGVIGGGTWLPDSLYSDVEGIWQTPSYINASLLPPAKSDQYTRFGFLDKLWFAIQMLWANRLGYFITAIALSLGAPFWFDLLNKLMKLKAAVSAKDKNP